MLSRAFVPACFVLILVGAVAHHRPSKADKPQTASMMPLILRSQ